MAWRMSCKVANGEAKNVSCLSWRTAKKAKVAIAKVAHVALFTTSLVGQFIMKKGLL